MSLQRIAVDLSYLLEPGVNGGSAVFVLDLLEEMVGAHPKTQFLFVAEIDLDCLRPLLSLQNVEYICPLSTGSLLTSIRNSILVRSQGEIFHRLGFCLPSVARWLLGVLPYPLRKHSPDLLFAPFTTSRYFDPGVPTVSVIYDLQHRDYPQFFSRTEISERDIALRNSVLYSDLLIAISKFSAQQLRGHFEVDPESVSTIPISISSKESLDRQAAKELLNSLGIEERGYLLFPANYWPHKNHRLLILAFSQYLARNPDSSIKLLLTGHSNPIAESLLEEIDFLGLGDRVVMAGYTTSTEICALFACAKALIFPSLYEGFGMPVLEALAMNIPVWCSDLPAIREFGGDNVNYFNPRSIESIQHAIQSADAVLDGQGASIPTSYQLNDHPDVSAMARSYWDHFEQTLDDHSGVHQIA